MSKVIGDLDICSFILKHQNSFDPDQTQSFFGPDLGVSGVTLKCVKDSFSRKGVLFAKRTFIFAKRTFIMPKTNFWDYV